MQLMIGAAMRAAGAMKAPTEISVATRILAYTSSETT
jgi:hypothetical protein